MPSATARVALLLAQQRADLRARARGLDELQPVLVRLLVRGGDDLDRVAVAELVAQRDDQAVDARARAVVADLECAPSTRSRSGSSPWAAPSRRPSA